MKERPILMLLMGYILGIIWGLYFNFSIVFLHILLLIIYSVTKLLEKRRKAKFKLISIYRYSRYFKIMINKKVIFLFLISSIISNTIVLYQNKIYKESYEDEQKIKFTGIVVSQKIEKDSYNLYKVKALKKHWYIQVKKDLCNLDYGDKIQLEGKFKKPQIQRNYGGYNDEQYLKTKKIIGRIAVKKVNVLEKEQQNIILQNIQKLRLRIEEKIDENFEETKAGILKGLLIGETKEIEDEVKENFQISNISHVLAISGMHIHYVILGVSLGVGGLLGKRKTKILIVVLLVFYEILTNFLPSVTRAVIMGIVSLGSNIFYRKNDILNSISISLLIILLYNPFLILNIGVQLSYLGTIGIIAFEPIIKNMLNKKMKEKTSEVFAVCISAQITILPILFYNFNMFSTYFIITNLLVSFIIGPIIIIGFIFLISPFFNRILSNILIIGLEVLMWISEFSKLPFSKIYVKGYFKIVIIIYFIIIFILRSLYHVYNAKAPSMTVKRIKNLISLMYYNLNKNRAEIKLLVVLIVAILVIFVNIPKNLKIYFVDVGQGDCTFITTPKNQTILLDGRRKYFWRF